MPALLLRRVLGKIYSLALGIAMAKMTAVTNQMKKVVLVRKSSVLKYSN